MLTTDAVSLFIASRVARGLSPRTISWYKQILDSFARRWTELPATPEEIDLFLGGCPGKDERRHGYYRALRALYAFLERRYHIPNPIKLVDAPRRLKKEPGNLTYRELYVLLSHPHYRPVAVYLAFLGDTGCRLGELHNLALKDFIETPYGYVAKVNGKTGCRLVPVSKSIAENLMPYLPFKVSIWWLGRLLSNAFKMAGVSGSAHTLRHTFGTLWEGDDFALQRILGHSKIETTRLYRHLRTERLSIQHNQFSPIARLPSSALQTAML